MPNFAISDIHGCANTFDALLNKIAFSQSDTLYLLGDYIDRGPKSKAVIDRILQLRSEGYTVHCLRGNHEQMMLDAMTDYDSRHRWRTAGGLETLDSFGVAHLSEIPAAYLDFLNSLSFCFEVDEYILVHAGLTFLHHSPLEERVGMLWKRSWYYDINYEWLGNRIIVHGHTPQTIEESLVQLAQLQDKKYLNIDNGCVFRNRVKDRSLGHLMAFDMTNRALHWVEYAD